MIVRAVFFKLLLLQTNTQPLFILKVLEGDGLKKKTFSIQHKNTSITYIFSSPGKKNP